MRRYASLSSASIEAAPLLLHSTMHGLVPAEASARLAQYGPNYVEYTKTSWAKLLVRQANSFFTYLLLAAALIDVALAEYTDASLILAFIGIFIGAGFYQEHKAENIIFSLRKFFPQYAKVRRNNEMVRIDIKDLVPGDIVFVHEGDLVPADIRLLHTKNLLVDESSLTGESMPVAKSGEPVSRNLADDLEATSLCFFGSTIVGGFAQALVIATGANTYFSHLFAKISEIERPSLFETNVRTIGTFLTNLILFLSLLAFGVRFAITGSIDLGFLIFLVALVVAAVPEALPLVVTLTLSRGTLALAQRGVVVKRLTSLEDLGNIDVLCTDKTGTITENKLTLTAFYTANEQELTKLAFVSSLSGKKIGKLFNPFDIALFDHMEIDAAREISGYEFLEFLPFDPVRKVNSLVFKAGNTLTLVTRGAPEVVLAASSYYRASDGTAHEMTEDHRNEALAWFRERGFKGDRILAVGTKEANDATIDIKTEEQRGLIFEGMLAFSDPLKPTSQKALELTRKLGVALKIISGDAPEVAGAVGYELGLIAHKEDVLTGAAFDALDIEGKRLAVNSYSVFARTSPTTKQEIITLLRESHAVAFLGDGFNDVPALKAAGVALTVHGASDMARSVSDIIFLQEDLLVIARGIEEGRHIFANVVKYIRTTLAANVGNFLSLSIVSFFMPFLPMLPIQLLLVNLLSDFPMISIGVDRVSEKEVQKPQAYDTRSLFMFVIVFGLVNSLFDFYYFSVFGTSNEAVIRTGWFILSIFTEIAAFISLRTLLPFWKGGAPARGIVIFSIVACTASIILVALPATRLLFSFAALTLPTAAAIGGMTAAYFVTNEVVKAVYAKITNAVRPMAVAH
jgi:Mg2+-importing ATPase